MSNHIWISDGELFRSYRRWAETPTRSFNGCQHESSGPRSLGAWRRTVKKRAVKLTLARADSKESNGPLKQKEQPLNISRWEWQPATRRSRARVPALVQPSPLRTKSSTKPPIPCRHGSSGLGSLEAWRRARKRCMMNLTSTRAGSREDNDLLACLEKPVDLPRWKWQAATKQQGRIPMARRLDLDSHMLKDAEALPRLFALLHQMGRHGDVVRICQQIVTQRVSIHPNILRKELLWAASVDAKLAIKLHDDMFRYGSISLNFHLSIRLIQAILDGPIRAHPSQLLHILERATGCKRQQISLSPKVKIRYVGRSETVRPDKKPTALESASNLIHQMASVFAHASYLSDREAYRWVHACYRVQIQDWNRLRPELSRALTHAGIIRLLRVGKWVSGTQLRYILNIVQAVEGTTVARRVDETVYRWRELLQARMVSAGSTKGFFRRKDTRPPPLG